MGSYQNRHIFNIPQIIFEDGGGGLMENYLKNSFSFFVDLLSKNSRPPFISLIFQNIAKKIPKIYSQTYSRKKGYNSFLIKNILLHYLAIFFIPGIIRISL